MNANVLTATLNVGKAKGILHGAIMIAEDIRYESESLNDAEDLICMMYAIKDELEKVEEDLNCI